LAQLDQVLAGVRRHVLLGDAGYGDIGNIATDPKTTSV
jgi:hypothetical protein